MKRRDRGERLTARMAWERAGMTQNAWYLAPRTRTGRPRPDGNDLGVDWWYAGTINDWIGERRRLATATRHETIVAAMARRPLSLQDVREVAARLEHHPRTIARHIEQHDAGRCACGA